jgi:hypothetical protein
MNVQKIASVREKRRLPIFQSQDAGWTVKFRSLEGFLPHPMGEKPAAYRKAKKYRVAIFAITNLYDLQFSAKRWHIYGNSNGKSKLSPAFSEDQAEDDVCCGTRCCHFYCREFSASPKLRSISCPFVADSD